jgi:NADH-quinone oxidoreductase subunit C
VADPLTAADLRALLERDLPGALAPTVAPSDEPAAHAKKGEAPPANLLATRDAVIFPERLPDVAAYLRERHGYELLTNLTATDYLADGVIELIYHLARLTGGPPITIKLRVPRDAAHVPSLTEVWPGADLQEREAFDLFGVQFRGHPNLRRIYMWDEFVGFPMRKDFPKQGDKYFGDAEA